MIVYSKITRFTNTDIPGLRKLISDSYQYSRPEGQLCNLIETEPRYNFCSIATTEERIGALVYWDFENFCFVEALAIAEQYRKQGIATKALEYLAEKVQKPLLTAPLLLSGKDVAEQFLSSCGFSHLKENYALMSYSNSDKKDGVALHKNQEIDNLVEVEKCIENEVCLKPKLRFGTN